MPEIGSSRSTRRLAESLIENRGRVVAAITVVTLFFGFFLLRSRLAFNFGELLPQKHPFIQTHNRYGGVFGESNTLVVMLEVKEGTVFNIPTLTTLVEVTRAMEHLPGVNHDQINSLAHRSTRWLLVRPGGLVVANPVMLRPPVNQEEIEKIEHIVSKSPHIYGVMVSLDKRSLIVRAGFHERLLDFPKLFAAVNQGILAIPHDPNLDVYVVGMPRLYGWIYQYVGEILMIFLGTVVLVWILLYLYFRDWRGSLRPTISGGLAAVWGLGFIRLIGFSLDPLTLIVPFFITARAVSHSVQMHDRYYEELGRGRTQHEAIIEAFAGLFVPTLSGILTDAFGVLVILLVPIVALQKLAVAASFWILAIVASELLLNPIVYYYLRAPEPEMVILREEGWFRRLMDRITDSTLSAAGRVVTIGIWTAIFVFSLIFLRGLTIGDPTAASPLLWPDSPYNQSHTRIQQFFGGVEPLIVVVEGKAKKALQEPAALDAMESFQRYVDSDPDVGYSFSLADIVKSINMVFFDTDPRWGVIPEEVGRIANLFFFYFAGSPPSETSKYLDPSYTNGHVTFFCRNHQGETVARIINRCREYINQFPSDKIDFRLAGGLIGVTAAANEEIVRNDILMNVLGLATIYLILLFTYRSFAAGIYMLLPLFVSNAFVNAYMSLRNIGVNLHTLPVVTVGIGFGIDYGLYIVSRIIEEVRISGDLYEATKTALCTTGKGVAFTAVTMVLSTMFWTTSNIRFDAEMGGLLAIWMGVSFIASQTLMPVLILVFRPKFITREIPPAAAARSATA